MQDEDGGDSFDEHGVGAARDRCCLFAGVHSVVISVIAARADDSSTMPLLSA